MLPETTRETSHPHLQTNFPSFGNPRAVAARNGWPEGHFSGNYSKHPSHLREVRNIIDSKNAGDRYGICMDISSQEWDNINISHQSSASESFREKNEFHRTQEAPFHGHWPMISSS